MIYRGGQVTAEADSAGTLTLGYLWGVAADDLVAVRVYGSGPGDTLRYYVAQDALRSVRSLSRSDGTWTASLRYDTYGKLLNSAGTIPFKLRYRWIGREFDEETGFYYLRARYYDPASQRFTQEDPIGYAGGSNVYAYGHGNPTNSRDLTGLAPHYDVAFQSTYLPPFPVSMHFRFEDDYCFNCSAVDGFDLMNIQFDRFYAHLGNLRLRDEYEAYLENAKALKKDNQGHVFFNCYSGPCGRPLEFIEYARLRASGLAEGRFTNQSFRLALLSYLQSGALYIGKGPAETLFWYTGKGSSYAQTQPGLFMILRADVMAQANLFSGLAANLLVHEWGHMNGIHHTSQPNNCTLADRVTIFAYGQGGCLR